MNLLCKDMEEFGKGIGNAARYKIVEALRSGPKTVGEITESVGLSQSAVSQHLAKMKRCHLVEDERKGNEVFYSLNTRHLASLIISFLEVIRPNKNSNKSQTT